MYHNAFGSKALPASQPNRSRTLRGLASPLSYEKLFGSRLVVLTLPYLELGEDQKIIITRGLDQT